MKIDIYTPHWHHEVLTLMGKVSGEHHFVNQGKFSTQSDFVLLLGYESDKNFVGFTQGRLLSQGELREHHEHRITTILPKIVQVDRDGALGVIETIAVAPGHSAETSGNSARQAYRSGR